MIHLTKIEMNPYHTGHKKSVPSMPCISFFFQNEAHLILLKSPAGLSVLCTVSDAV
jgi:hypothetical protein